MTKNTGVSLIEFYGKSMEINGKKAMVGGIIELSTKASISNSSNKYAELTEILQYLTEEDRVIVKSVISTSKFTQVNTLKEKKILKKIGLTNRELEVLSYICQGLTNNDIAKKLFLSKRTIDRHRANILEKTNINNTAKLVAFAIKHKLVDL